VHSRSVGLHQGSVGEGHPIVLRRPHLSAGHRRQDRGHPKDAGKEMVVLSLKKLVTFHVKTSQPNNLKSKILKWKDLSN
jgi:hypothetical protein